ncbi:DUF6479 family protein [Propionimicrobium sp. PCR01-08-3]|uniref:DUF6479 family protein n=1 Tax=Propionimicrobium sp. PCR01-08-3 TaxID=3052086 RepID=UPI00255CE5F3|nr:DUF6479 family protein [Propionimicrobium sp. PCR01-08-3]WIY82672.1 hypothetical protein QQ658_14410 [Propionimicrobium sp. PCR01-08-3]
MDERPQSPGSESPEDRGGQEPGYSADDPGPDTQASEGWSTQGAGQSGPDFAAPAGYTPMQGWQPSYANPSYDRPAYDQPNYDLESRPGDAGATDQPNAAAPQSGEPERLGNLADVPQQTQQQPAAAKFPAAGGSSAEQQSSDTSHQPGQGEPSTDDGRYRPIGQAQPSSGPGPASQFPGAGQQYASPARVPRPTGQQPAPGQASRPDGTQYSQPPSGAGQRPPSGPVPPGNRQPAGGPANGSQKVGIAPVIGAIAIGVVLALVVWLVAHHDPEPEPGPGPSAQTTETDEPTDEPTETEEPAIANQKSDRTTPWQVTRTEPRTGVAPTAQLGEETEYVDPDGIGLVTVMDAQWVDPGGRSMPDGYASLAVQVRFEAVQGEIRYSPTGCYATDSDGGRYTFGYNSRIEGDHPQFDIGTVPEGYMMTGWVIFEAPTNADMTFVFESFSEQAVRVDLPGDGPVDPVTPPIAVNKTFDVDDYGATGTLAVEGAAWFSDQGTSMLGIKVRVSASADQLFLCDSDFIARDENGVENEYELISDEPVYRPNIDCTSIVEGDQMSGWVYFELSQQPITIVYDNGYGERTEIEIPN